MNIRKGSYLLSDNKELIDLDVVCKMLWGSYWACDRTKEAIKKSIDNSKCFGLYLGGKQIGFTRVVTDEATFAWICDVIVEEEYRGKGLGKWMVDYAVNYGRTKEILQVLSTKDAHGLYEKYGFKQKECLSRKG